MPESIVEVVMPWDEWMKIKKLNNSLIPLSPQKAEIAENLFEARYEIPLNSWNKTRLMLDAQLAKYCFRDLSQTKPQWIESD